MAEVMLLLAKQLQGHWEKTDNGYRLVSPLASTDPENPEAPAPVPSPPSMLWRWLVSVLVLLLASIIVAVVAHRKRRGKPTSGTNAA